MIDKKHIGHELPASVLDVEKGRLRFFAKAIGETDPVYTDEAAAEAAGYRACRRRRPSCSRAELDAGADPRS